MLKLKIKLLFYSGFWFFIAMGCKTVEELSSDEKVNTSIKTDSLLQSLAVDTIKYDYLFSKIGISLESKERNVSFNATVRITKDSAMSATLSFFNIIVANALIRPDSAFVSNKRNDCYVQMSINDLSKLINVDLGYKPLQRLLSGVVPFYDTSLNWQQLKRDNFYVVSSHSDREIKKILEKTPAREWDDQDRIYRYFFTPKEQKIKASRIDIPQDTLTMIIEQISTQKVDGRDFPMETIITIEKANTTTKIELNYKRVRFNKPHKLHFVIPDNYDECK